MMRRDYCLMDVGLAEALWLRFRRWGDPPSPVTMIGRKDFPANKYWGDWPIDARPASKTGFVLVVLPPADGDRR